MAILRSVKCTCLNPTAATVSPVEEAIRFTMSGDASGNFTPGFYNGNVTVTASGDDYIVTFSITISFF